MARYSVVTQKSIQGYAWENTWHVEAITLATANSAAVALATFEAALLWEDGQVDGTRVSPWPNGSSTGFINSTLNIAGGRAMANPLSAASCLFVDIGAATGRPGRKWFRMSLDEGEVNQVAGKPNLLPDAGVRTIFLDARDDLVSALDVLGVDLLIGAGSLTARAWSATMAIQGVGIRQIDVGWYNKEATP